MKKRYQTLILSIFLCFALKAPVYSQTESLIFADVVLKNKQVVSGFIQWSGGQALWSDVLKVSKSNTAALKYLNGSQLKEITAQGGGKDLDWQFMNLWKDKLPERADEALCQFGDIDFIHVTGSASAQIYNKVGSKMRVSEGSSGDLGREIVVYGSSRRRISWNDISRINFKRAAENISSPFKGDLLYGSVYTTSGIISGYIRWDKSKFHNSQVIYGRGNAEVVGVKLDDIKKIAKKDKGAVVTTESGREVFLQGSRDVSESNRGIRVITREYGPVVVNWKAFKSVVFQKSPGWNIDYSNFEKPRRIYATVLTHSGKVYKGNCTFDLDEEWNFELLEGNRNNIRFQIPFHMLNSLRPLPQNQSEVLLKSGRKFIVKAHQDVSDKNWGLIIWLANKGHQYIPREDVKDIKFR